MERQTDLSFNGVSLKVLSSEDLELVRIWRNSPEVSSFMYSEDQISADQQVRWFEKINQDSSSIYWVITHNKIKVGLASITAIDYNLSSCFLASYLGEPESRSKGIGSKVELLIIQYVFNVLKLNKLRCEVFVTNERGIRIHEKFGFRREAYFREHCLKNNNKFDVIGLALLKSEWEILSSYYEQKLGQTTMENTSFNSSIITIATATS